MTLKLKEFTGTKSEDLEGWILQLEYLLEDEGIIEDSRKIGRALMHLSGEALKWYRVKKNDETLPAQFELFKTELRKKFSGAKKLLCKMFDGDLEQYIETFEGIVQQGTYDEKVKTKLFIDGLEDNYFAVLAGSNWTNYVAAKEVAIEMNTRWKEKTNNTTFSVFRTQAVQPWNDQKVSLFEKGLCFHCEEAGHISKECPLKKKRNSFRGDQGKYKGRQ